MNFKENEIKIIKKNKNSKKVKQKVKSTIFYKKINESNKENINENNYNEFFIQKRKKILLYSIGLFIENIYLNFNCINS